MNQPAAVGLQQPAQLAYIHVWQGVLDLATTSQIGTSLARIDQLKLRRRFGQIRNQVGCPVYNVEFKLT